MRKIASALLLFLVLALTASACGSALPGIVSSQNSHERGESQSVAAPKAGGKLAFSKDRAIWLLEGGSAKQVTTPEEGTEDIQPCFSPDGTRLAFVRRGDSYGEIMVLNLQTNEVVQLTANKSYYTPETLEYVQYCNWAFRPTWSPDGSTLVYLSDVTTYDMALWTVPSAGGQPVQLTRVADGVGGFDKPVYSPDGALIYTARFAGGSQQIWSLNLYSGEWTQITMAGDAAYDPAISDDGMTLAFAVRKGTSHDIWLMDLNTGDTRQITDTGSARGPEWAGESLVFLMDHDGSFDLDEATIPAEGATTSQNRLTSGLRVDANSGVSWSK